MKNISSYMKTVALAISLLIFASMAAAGATNYYLHDTSNMECNGNLMDTSPPSSPYTSYLKLEDGPGIWCTKPFKSDAGVQGDVRVTLYVEAFFLKPDLIPFQIRIIKVSLLDVYNGNMDVIASSRATPIIYISNNTLKSRTFVINNVDYTIPAGHSIGIKVEKVVDFLSYFPFSVLAPFFATNLLYDSADAPSFVELPINITGGGIYIECYDRQESVKPGGEADYGIIIYNNASISATVSLSTDYSGNDWKIEMPSVVKVPANSFNYTDIIVRAPGDAKPGDYLNITVTATSDKGSYSIWLNTTVVPYQYGVLVTAKDNSKKARPGSKVNFTFAVKNTGDVQDTFTLSVDCSWAATLSKNKITLDKGESTNVVVSVKVPINATNGTRQRVTLHAKSVASGKEGSASSQIIVIYEAAPSTKKKNIMETVAYILFIAGVAALLVIAAWLGRVAKKTVALAADERMAEITPGKRAVFTIKISNPLEKIKGGKNKIKYKISIEGNIPEKWTAKVDREQIVLDGGEKAEIKLIVDVPKDAPIDEWASVDVVVSPSIGKSERLNFLITLKEPEPILSIEYEHEGEMKEGNKIITKIFVKNDGDADAKGKSIVILVNGKEKNRIDGVDIPAKGAIEVELPWVAEKENEVEVKII